MAMLRAPIPRIAVENPIMLGHVRRLFDLAAAVTDERALAVRESRD
jgi:hypothetical protein